jgi:hypothetical protein
VTAAAATAVVESKRAPAPTAERVEVGQRALLRTGFLSECRDRAVASKHAARGSGRTPARTDASRPGIVSRVSGACRLCALDFAPGCHWWLVNPTELAVCDGFRPRWQRW